MLKKVTFTGYMKIMRHLPNSLTCLNLFCGCLAVVFISRNELQVASWLVIVAGVIDFMDGFAARLLKAYSPIGKQLDSLADMISFGLVPGFMLYQIMADSMDLYLLKNEWITFIPFIVTIFSALRLARFNIDERQTEDFIGLPTPASTLFIISIPFIMEHSDEQVQLIAGNPVFQLLSAVMLSVLMVAEIRMFSLKFNHFGWKNNELRYLLLLLSCVLISLLRFTAIPLIIILYVLMSLVAYRAAKQKK
jgi:CDP-diacylglycerol--serine O-phosphatidyltransferase